MFRIATVALVTLLSVNWTASAADVGTQSSPSEKVRAACTQAGFKPGEVNYNDCVSTLRQTIRSMHMSMKGKMSSKACALAGLQEGSDAFNACVDKLNTAIEDDARDLG